MVRTCLLDALILHTPAHCLIPLNMHWLDQRTSRTVFAKLFVKKVKSLGNIVLIYFSTAVRVSHLIFTTFLSLAHSFLAVGLLYDACKSDIRWILYFIRTAHWYFLTDVVNYFFNETLLITFLH